MNSRHIIFLFQIRRLSGFDSIALDYMIGYQKVGKDFSLNALDYMNRECFPFNLSSQKVTQDLSYRVSGGQMKLYFHTDSKPDYFFASPNTLL